jgi:SAM-dependent methyltransferase
MLVDQHRVRMIRATAQHDADVFRVFIDAARANGIDPYKSRVLDVGCGDNAPMTVLLHAAGATVTGIDHYIGHRWGLGVKPSRYWRHLQKVGPARAMRKVIGELTYDRHYWNALETATGLPLTDRGLDLREMKIEQMDIPSDSVDVIHSNATWEHLVHVDRANREVARVLRPRGVAFIEIHLFPSLSGGHDLPWIVPGTVEMGGQLPWRHLRDPNWTPPVGLNRWRERQYRQAFEGTPGLEIINWQTEYTEGAHLLDADTRAALPDWTDEELTKRSIIVTVRKTGH